MMWSGSGKRTTVLLLLVWLCVCFHAALSAVIVDRISVDPIYTPAGVDTTFFYGDILHAVNVNGLGDFAAGDANVLTINSFAYSTSSVQFFGYTHSHAWSTSTVDYGTTTEINNLESMASRGFHSYGTENGFILKDVGVGYHRLTLPFSERDDPLRRVSIAINGNTVFSCFGSGSFTGVATTSGDYFVVDFHQTVANDPVEIRFIPNCNSPYNNPTFYGYTLKKIYPNEFPQPQYRDATNQLCPINQFGDNCACESTTLGGETDTPTSLVQLEPDLTRVIGGNLVIVFTEPRKYRHKWFQRPDIRFLNSNGEEAANAFSNCYSKFTWTVSEDTAGSCVGSRVWTGTGALTDVFDSNFGCVHEAPVAGTQNGQDVDFVGMYLVLSNGESVLSVEGDGAGTSTGTYIAREVVHPMPFRLGFQTTVDVETTSITAYSNVAAVRATIKQTAGYVEGGAGAYVDVFLFTSVQSPFRLQPSAEAPTSSSPKLTIDTPVFEASPLYTCNQGEDCDLMYRVQIRDTGGQCNFDGTFTVIMSVLCNPVDSPTCPLDGTETATIIFTLDTNGHASGSCAVTVLDQATLQNEIFTYQSNDYNLQPVTDFVDNEIMYFRTEIWSSDMSLKSAYLASVEISGAGIPIDSPIALFTNGFVVGDAATTWAFANTDHTNVNTNPSDETDRLLPSFQFLCRTSAFGVSSRSTDSITVTAVYEIVYEGTLSSLDEKPAFQTMKLSRDMRLQKDTSSDSISTQVLSVSGRRVQLGEQDATTDPTTTSNVLFLAVCLASFMALVVALIAVSRVYHTRAARKIGSDGEFTYSWGNLQEEPHSGDDHSGDEHSTVHDDLEEATHPTPDKKAPEVDTATTAQEASA